jgi:hypothetical protein
MVLGAATVAAAGLLLFLLGRDTTPFLTRPAFEEAFRKWKADGTADYDLELLLEGDRAAPQRFKLAVRGGQVVRFEENGRLEARARAGEGYSVAGLFDVIDRELEMRSGPPSPGAPARATLRARFDPERGYPTAFERIAPKGMSRFLRVERFAPVAP